MSPEPEKLTGCLVRFLLQLDFGHAGCARVRDLLRQRGLAILVVTAVEGNQLSENQLQPLGIRVSRTFRMVDDGTDPAAENDIAEHPRIDPGREIGKASCRER